MKKLTIEQRKLISNDQNYKIIVEVIEGNRLIADRIKALEEIGFNVINKAFGTGGVGMIRQRKDGIYLQISCGMTRHNYAYAVRIGEFQDGKLI